VTVVHGAVRDARFAWRPRTTLFASAIVVAAFVPLVTGGARTADLAAGLYLASAAVALAFVVGVAGLPSLAQGAFMAVGAVVAAHIGSTVAGAVAGCAAAGLAAGVVGAAFARLPRAGFAAATWIVSWLVATALQSLAWPLGGTEGMVVSEGPSLTGHYELALALTVLAALAYAALRRAPFGLQLAAARDREAAASAFRIPVKRLRTVAVACSGAVAGLAGALTVHLAGVGDPASFGPYLSFKLFVVVLIGGALAPLGAAAGVIVLGILSVAADAIGSIEHVAAARSHTLLAAIMLLGVVSLGWEGILRPARARRPARPGPEPPRDANTTVNAVRLSKRYGDVVAADEISFDVQPGRITALVGPNGSGKTTLLRMLAGTIEPDGGTIRGERSSLARTLQATAVFPSLTPLEHLLAASARRRKHAAVLRSLLSTPKARREDASFTAWAERVLERFALPAGVPAGELPVSDQRALMVATAYATGASVLLVDEPTAGASHVEAERIAGLLRSLRDEGLGLLVVEHNLGIVQRIADDVVVLGS
jgi:ABC-type branched-subunit amino acid transport system ATPase component/ABC-type branched-subunit amino acid transport system permease subunit